MKRALLPLVVIFLVLFYSCENFTEDEAICLPVNMTATIIEGAEAKKIIADFHYVEGTSLLDHITWSNHQTHHFEYDEMDRILVVKVLKVKVKIQEEKWFTYDGERVERITLVKKNLDQVFLEPIDSTVTGYIEFEYEDNQIIGEKRYENQDEGLILVWEVIYEYDGNGNMLNSVAKNHRKQSEERKVMTYDNSKHPFSNLLYYFTGESYVNNPSSKQVEEEQLSFDYDLRLNEYGYPETIYEKLGSVNSRIIRYSYKLQ
jgi:hypothetical protein